MTILLRPWYAYLLECADGHLYCGVTVDVKARLTAHNSGTASKCTRSRRPVRLLAVSCPLSRAEAMRLEARIKRVQRREKLRTLLEEAGGPADPWAGG